MYEEEDIKNIHFSWKKGHYASNLKQIYTYLNRIKVSSTQYINNFIKKIKKKVNLWLISIKIFLNIKVTNKQL